MVVVVSAMGDTTDELIDLAQQVSPLPAGRELDMLLTAGERISMALVAMAIAQLGHKAQSFTGSQAGVITDSVHGKAKIIDITPGRIENAINDGAIAEVVGMLEEIRAQQPAPPQFDPSMIDPSMMDPNMIDPSTGQPIGQVLPSEQPRLSMARQLPAGVHRAARRHGAGASWGGRSGTCSTGARSRPCAFQCSTARVVSSDSAWPIASSRLRKPSAAGC